MKTDYKSVMTIFYHGETPFIAKLDSCLSTLDNKTHYSAEIYELDGKEEGDIIESEQFTCEKMQAIDHFLNMAKGCLPFTI